MCEEYRPSIFQADGAGIQNQVGEVFDDAIAVDNPSWYDDQFPRHEPQDLFSKDPGSPQRRDQTESKSHVRCPPTGLTHAETTFGTQEQGIVIDEDMDIDGDAERVGQAENFVFEGSTIGLEWAIVPSREPRAGELCRCQRRRL
ncbi:hypothetical protein AYI68_g7777, partial [Smittium mucronatum]